MPASNIHSTQKLIIISAPSGAGKTTIVKSILKEYANLVFSISATTRAKRANEKDGLDYYFMTEANFKEGIKNNDFIEWEMVYQGKYYGTLKSELQRIWNIPKTPLLEVDVKGAIRIKDEYMDAMHVTNIFIQAPSIAVLKERLLGRGSDDMQTIEERIQKAEYELQFMSRFDHVVENNDLETCLREVRKIIQTVLSPNTLAS